MDKLASDDGSLMDRALNNIAKWERDQVCHKRYVQRWREILGLPLTDARELVLAETPDAMALRQNHPFAGFFSESERQSLRRASIE
jgi:hypothetical protein